MPKSTKRTITRLDELISQMGAQQGRKLGRRSIARRVGFTGYKLDQWGNSDLAWLDEINALCEFFDCEPGDLFRRVEVDDADIDTPEGETLLLAAGQ